MNISNNNNKENNMTTYAFTTYAKHLAMPMVAAQYNYGHEVLIDEVPPTQLIVFMQLSGTDRYIAETTSQKDWMVVRIESQESMEHCERLVQIQRERLWSGLYPSFVSPEKYITTANADGTTTMSLDIPMSMSSED